MSLPIFDVKIFQIENTTLRKKVQVYLIMSQRYLAIMYLPNRESSDMIEVLGVDTDPEAPPTWPRNPESSTRSISPMVGPWDSS